MCSSDLKQPMGLVSPWLLALQGSLPRAVILLNRAGASVSSWKVRLWSTHTQFSTDCNGRKQNSLC